jgi:hypothetical protein
MQIADESDVRELHRCCNYGTWILNVSSPRLSSRSLKTTYSGKLTRYADRKMRGAIAFGTSEADRQQGSAGSELTALATFGRYLPLMVMLALFCQSWKIRLKAKA